MSLIAKELLREHSGNAGHAALPAEKPLQELCAHVVTRPPRSVVDETFARHEAIKGALKSGQIPPELSDEVRLVPLDSPAGIRFQEAMEAIAKRFLKDWEPAGQPVRFGLMDLPGVNACQVKGAEPPLILFNAGCFKETIDDRGKKIPPLKTIDEVALIFAHERVHLLIEQRYNTPQNSKLEESMASYASIEATYLAGFDPRAALEWYRQRVDERRESFWGEVLDEHPVPASALSLYETALTALNRKYGAIGATPTQLDGDSELSRAAVAGHHTSTLEQRLAAEGYNARSLESQGALLAELIQSHDFLESRRLDDLCQRISILRKESGFDPQNANHALAPIFDASLATAESGYTRAALRLLTRVADSKEGYRPIGRLAPLAEACQAFIEAPDLTSAQAAAHDIARLSEIEPLAQTRHGLEVLRRFAFPQFDYPDPDKIERMARKGGVPISWNSHIKLAREEVSGCGRTDITRAMLLLGVDDERLYGHMDPILALKFFSGALEPISAGPKDGSSTVQDLKIVGGRAVKIALFSSERSGNRDQVKSAYLLQYAENIFKELPALREGEERNEQIGELKRISRWILESDKESDHRSLLGLNSLEAAPELFTILNRDSLLQAKGQQTLLPRLRDLHAAGDSATVRTVYFTLIRLLEPDMRSITPPEPARGEIFAEWRVNHGTGEARSVSPLTGPLIRFALAAQPPLFSLDERLGLIAKGVNWAGLLDYGLALDPKNGGVALTASGRAHLIGLLNALSPVLHEQGLNLTIPRNWDELHEQIKQLALERHPLGRAIVTAEAAILLSKRGRSVGLSTPQVVSILRILQQDLSGDSPGISQWRKGRGEITPYIREKLAGLVTDPPSWSTDLGTAIADWQTLYRAGALSATKQYRYLNDLVAQIDSIATPTERLPHYENLLGTTDTRVGDPELRNRLIKCWASSLRDIYGQDDRSSEYSRTILQTLERVKDRFESKDRSTIFNTLAQEIGSQRELTRAIELESTVITADVFGRSHKPLIVIEGGKTLFIDSREKRFAIIDYLSSGFSTNAADTLAERVIDWLGVDSGDPSRVRLKRLVEGQVTDMHKNFWAAPLEARALIMKEILIPHEFSRRELREDYGGATSVEEAQAKCSADAFRYTLERVFPDSASHAETSRRWVSAYIDGMPDYSRHIALSALLVAGQKTAEAGRSTGFAIASFLESMGPAETKAGQAAQGHPNTPDDIRADLARLKTHADEPPRWELFKLIDQAFPEDDENPIAAVGAVLGSASFYVAVDVTLKDGSNAVLSLLRPNALQRSHFGFEMMGNMIERFDHTSDSFRVMRELISDARELAEIETRPRLAQIQRERAESIYNGMEVVVEGRPILFTVPSVIGVGDYHVLSQRAPGEHYIDLPRCEERRRLAKAIMTVELNNILSGRPFDNDRHGGNCRIEGNTVHHFDFGGMMLEDPTSSDLKELGEAIVAAGLGAQSVEDFVNRYFGVLRDRQARGEPVSPILKRAQKALLSVAEYSEDLTKEDLLDVLISAAAQELHPAVREAVEGAVMGALMNDGSSSPGIDLPRILAALENPPIKITRTHRGD